MIKCLECGFRANRLQWTHFKFNCTGKFKNGKEYQQVYKNALLVSPELAKKTSITLDNFIIKYGDDEGKLRWDRYREKQANSNSFEYKKEKYGWSKDQYDEYNSSRSVTLENMIVKHGEITGAKKWIEYCERQAYTNTLSYFSEKYGNVEGLKKYKEVNKGKASASNPELLAEKLGIKPEEALEIILARGTTGTNKWGSNLEKEFTENLEIALNEQLQYTTFTKPFGKWSPDRKSYVMYDIKHNDCIIEFNGDYWHANPKLFKDDAKIRGVPAYQIHDRDHAKLELAKSSGFRIYVVWESDYKANKTQTINEVIKWMQSGQK